MSETAASELVVHFKLPRKLAMLKDMHAYKIAYGGRNSLKSWSFARTLLVLGVDQSLRVLCCREVQKSLTESVHQLLQDQIKALGLTAYYDVTTAAIRGTTNDTLFRFTGLAEHTVETIKSFEGFDIAWIEEAQTVKKRSFQILLPTLFRVPKSELWVSFNPDMDSDEVWQRFIVSPPPEAVVIEMNWRDAVKCGFWSPEQEKLRQYDLVHSKEDYPNIWDGKPRTVIAGAIYGPEVIEMVTERRLRPIPYDPRLPVHRIWDLGWNDLMTVIMVQKPHPSALNVINYMEDSHITYAAMCTAMDTLGYHWGVDWMPHDAEQHDPKSGTNAIRLMRTLRGGPSRDGEAKVRMIPKSNAENRIRAARMMFPRVYIDDTRRESPPERPDRQLGAGFLVERLKRYKRVISKTTNEPGIPDHDINSHGADAWGGLAEIVDRIRSDFDDAPLKIAGFKNTDKSMGMLG